MSGSFRHGKLMRSVAEKGDVTQFLKSGAGLEFLGMTAFANSNGSNRDD
jgi:hypothetical protein